MWTRERILTVAELCGFAAVVAAGALTAYAIAGVLPGVAAGLLGGGGATVYLANAYALPAAPLPPEEPPNAQH